MRTSLTRRMIGLELTLVLGHGVNCFEKIAKRL